MNERLRISTATMALVALAIGAVVFADEPQDGTPKDEPRKAAVDRTFKLPGAERIQYREAGSVKLHLHVYRPKPPQIQQPRAAIIFFFGGGWVGGTPAQFAPQCERLASRGMVAIAAEYRVRKRHGSTPVDSVLDARAAVRWVRAHARELGVDQARIAVAGGSAGGHLAACTAVLETLPEEDEAVSGDAAVSCQPNALILYNPVIDVSPTGFGRGKLRRLGWNPTQQMQLSPVHHVRRHLPPTLVFHGEDDKVVPIENVERFQRLMSELGNACQLVRYSGADHGFFNPGRPGSKYEDTTTRVEQFLTDIGFLSVNSAEAKIAGRSLAQWRELLDGEASQGEAARAKVSATRRQTLARMAAHSIAQFGKLAADDFAAMLEHSDPAVRYVAARAIGDTQEPRSAIPTLRRMLADDRHDTFVAAGYALARLGDVTAGLPALERAILSGKRGLACSGAELAGHLGDVANPLLSQMEEELQRNTGRGDYHIRGALQNAMRKIHGDESLTAHVRPSGGRAPRGWRPSGEGQGRGEIGAQPRPNILWISCEDISPNLGCYGDTYARTPNLDQLAREGARFERAFTPAGVCAVVRSGIITGMYPISQGSQHMRSHIIPPDGVRSFPEYLRQAGYFCTNKSKTDYQFPVPASVWDRQGNGHGDWRDRAPGQPFFSVINLTCTHESQIRHGKATHQALVDGLSPDQRHEPDAARPFLPPIHADTAESRTDWAWYADNISEMDRQVGLILRQLEDDGLAENTIVVFWSDHGRGLPRGKRWIYDSGVHVPMIVRWPGQIAPDTRRADLVSTQDLPPTMLAVAGIDVPNYMQGRIFLGAQQQPEPEFLFFHRDRMDEAYELMRAARNRRYKYIRNYLPGRTYAQNIDYMNKMPTLVDLRQGHADGTLNHAQSSFFRSRKPAEELYDTVSDPHETVNLAWLPEHAERLARMRVALEEWQSAVGDLGLMPEPVLMQQIRPNGMKPRVATPTIRISPTADGEALVDVECQTPSASIEYRWVAGTKLPSAAPGEWTLYVKPLRLPRGKAVQARACKAGWRDSQKTNAKMGEDAPKRS